MSFKKMFLTVIAACMIITAVPAQASQVQALAHGETTGNTNVNKKDARLLASIIYCEAGNQSYAGKLAVGCVVMNRKKSSSFPNTVKGVIYQKGQFSPVRQGKMKRELAKYDAGAYKTGARKQCLKAAKAALAGETYVTVRGKKINMRKYHFFSMRLSRAKLRIDGHDFK